MPKINAGGVPSYEGHEGTVTSATGEQFELNPDVDDENRTVEPAGEFDETSAPGGASGPTQVDDDADRRDDANSLDLRDQPQQQDSTDGGAKADVKPGSPTVKQDSKTSSKK